MFWVVPVTTLHPPKGPWPINHFCGWIFSRNNYTVIKDLSYCPSLRWTDLACPTLWPPKPSNSVTRMHSIFTIRSQLHHLLPFICQINFNGMSISLGQSLTPCPATYIWGCETVMQEMDNSKIRTNVRKQTSTYTLGQEAVVSKQSSSLCNASGRAWHNQ